MLTPEDIKFMNEQAGTQPDPTLSAQSLSSQFQAAWAPTPAPRVKLGQGAAGEFGAGVAGSLIKTGAGIESALDQTLGRGINLALGKGNIPTTTGAEARRFAESVTDQSGFSKTGEVVGTVAQLLAGPGGPVKTAVKETVGVVPKIVAGIASKAPIAAKDTAIATAQTGDVVQGLETGIGGQVIGALGKPVSATGKALYKGLSIPMSMAEARLVQAYKANVPFFERIATAIAGTSKAPITAAETAFQKGLMGTESGIGVQAKKATKSLWGNVIEPALKRSGVQVSMPTFFDEAAAKIKADTPELSRQKDLLEALDALRADYANVANVPIEKLQQFKEGWAKMVPQKAYQGKDIAGAFADVKNIVSGVAREKIHTAVGTDASRAYIDYGNLRGLAEWGQKAMTGAKFKGGAGGFLNAMKDVVLTPIATIGGQTVYKIGQGMEFIGAPGARYLSDLFNEESQPQQPQ